MRDDDDKPIAGKLFQKRKELPRRLSVEIARGLVCKQYAAPAHKRPRDGDALQLPARKFVGLSLHEPADAQLFQGLLRMGGSVRKGDVFRDGERGEDVFLLKDKAHRAGAVLIKLAGRHRRKRPSFIDDFARSRLFQPAEQIEKCRFSAPALAHEKEKPPLGKAKIDSFYGVDAHPAVRKALFDISQFQHVKPPPLYAVHTVFVLIILISARLSIGISKFGTKKPPRKKERSFFEMSL